MIRDLIAFLCAASCPSLPAADLGSKLWEFATEAPIFSSPAIAADGAIYIQSADGRIYALNPDGSKRWELGPGMQYIPCGDCGISLQPSHPVIGQDGTIFSEGSNYQVLAINPDGTLRGDLGQENAATVATDGTVYVGFTRTLRAYNPDLSSRWASKVSGFIFFAPSIGADGTLYFGGDAGLHSLFSDGSTNWTFAFGGGVGSYPAIAADGTIYFGGRDGNLYALCPDGSEKWSFTTANVVLSSPAIGPDGTVYFGSADGKLYALNSDGGLRWSFFGGGPILSSPAISADGTVYFGSDGGSLFALASDGSKKWSFATAGPVQSSPAIGPDGTVYFGSVDGKIYAVRGEGGLAANQWPMFRKDLRHSANLQTVLMPPEAPKNLRASKGTQHGVKVTWDAVLGAVSYEVWRSDENDFNRAVRIADVTASRTFDDYSAGIAINFYYWVKAINSVSISSPSASDVGYGRPALPEELVWKFRTEAGHISAPTIGDDGTVYFGAGDKFYAFTPDGREKWSRTETASGFVSTAIGSDGIIYVGGGTNLYALNLDGSTRWIYHEPEFGFFSSAFGPDDRASPSIGPDGTIYFVSGTSMYALYSDGRKRWSSNLGQFILASALAIDSEGTLYFYSRDQVNAFFPDGTVKWMTGQDLTGFYGSSPVIGVDGSIYLGSGFNLHAYKQNGTRRWFLGSFPTGDLIDSSPAVGIDGTIYFGSNDGNLYALDPQGRKRWSYRNEQGVISSPVLDGDGTIYIVNPGYSSYEGSLIAVNIGLDGYMYLGDADRLAAIDSTKFGRGSAVVWEVFLGSFDFETPAPSLGEGGAIYCGTRDGYFFSVSRGGQIQWQFNAAKGISSSPSVAPGGTIYFGSADGKLYALQPSGALKWTFATGRPIQSTPAVAEDGTIYLGSSASNVFYALNSDGTIKCQTDIGGPVVSSPAIDSEGNIYFGCLDGKFYAVKGTSRLADSSWPMYRGNLRHTASLVNAPVQPILIPPRRSRAMELRLFGEANREYNLEVSTNLVDWTVLASLARTKGKITILDESADSYSHRFYRAVAR